MKVNLNELVLSQRRRSFDDETELQVWNSRFASGVLFYESLRRLESKAKSPRSSTAYTRCEWGLVHTKTTEQATQTP